MAVTIGSARIDENGKIHSGKAGDQTGKEVGTQNWYKHAKGWVVLRPKDAAVAAKIAACMVSACANKCIGYDQYQRLTLLNACKQYGYDPGKVTANVETDCSALVRVCCLFAGIQVGDFTTGNEVAMLMATGKFDKLTAAKYAESPNYLKSGDILCTKTKGHTVIVLSSGKYAGADTVSHEFGARTLKQGTGGSDVKTLQSMLISLGYSCGKYGADGEFGGATVEAVKAYQSDKKLDADGIVGAKTFAALAADAEKQEDPADPPAQPEGGKLVVNSGNWHMRTGPGVGYASAGIVGGGAALTMPVVQGWVPVLFNGEVRWISARAVLFGTAV